MTIYSRMHNGKKQWQFRTYYKAIDGSRKQKNSKWFNVKKEAVQAELEFNQLTSPQKFNPTFKEVADKWIEFKKRDLKPSTISAKMVYINMLKPFFNKKIESISDKDITYYFEYGEGSKYTYLTKTTILTNFKSIFKFSNLHFGTTNDPFLRMAPLKKPIATDFKEVEVIDIDTFKKFYEHMRTTRNGKWEDTASMYWTLYFTGMRISECKSLPFNDFDGKCLNIHRQFVRGSWQTPKTKNSIRKITVDDKTKELIERQYEKYKNYPRFDKSWFIFSGPKLLNHETFRHRKNETCKEIGIKEFKIHDLRHSHASNLINAGVNIFKISKRLGHASISVTMDVYGHLIDTEEKEIIDILNTFI